MSSEPLSPAIDVKQYASIQGDLLAREFAAFREQSFDPAIVFGGRRGYMRRFSWQPPDGVTVRQVQIYAVEDDRGFTATCTAPESYFGRYEALFDSVLANLDLAPIADDVGEGEFPPDDSGRRSPPATNWPRSGVVGVPVVALEGEAVGGYLIGRNLLDERGLSGGGFGEVYEASSADVAAAVVKVGRARGGSRSSTMSPTHVPALGFVGITGGGLRPYTIGPDDVDDALRREAGLLQLDAGALLPRSFGLYDGPHGRPLLIMERVSGDRPATVEQVIEVLRVLAERSRAGGLRWHGDLKPEHIFLGDKVRLVDPAPRFKDQNIHGFTPAYNRFGLGGPAADVYAIAVMLDRMVVSRQVRAETPAPTMAAVEAFVAEVLVDYPSELPGWASEHGSALERLSSAT